MLISKSKVVSFLYHEVCDDPAESGFQRKSALPYKHNIREFLNNLNAIESVGIKPRLITDLAVEDQSSHHVLLTFDDGGKSAMRIADLLDEFDWKGHFFITTSAIGRREFVSRNDVRELLRRGHIVGTHSHTHPSPFYALNEEQMMYEWRTSIAILEDILGSSIGSASIPGGDSNMRVERIVAQIGIKYLFTSEIETTPWKTDNLWCFGRVYPKSGTHVKRIKKFAKNEGLFREKSIRELKKFVKLMTLPVYQKIIERRQYEELP